MAEGQGGEERGLFARGARGGGKRAGPRMEGHAGRGGSGGPGTRRLVSDGRGCCAACIGLIGLRR